MATKITLEPTDFKELVDYIYNMPLEFSRAEEAVKIKKIIESALPMNIEMKVNLNTNVSNSNTGK